MDLAAGYWQVEVNETNKEKTAFICCMGLFEFNVMPFGLTNAPETFQRMMDEVIGELGLKVVQNYIDNIIIGSETFKEHLETLERIFQQLEKARLRIKLQKYQFAKNTVIFLGHQL